MKQVVNSIRSEVSRLQLDGCEFCLAQPFDALDTAYNGTGPEFLPPSIRAKLDEVTAPFLPAVMVHDVDYTRSDGSFASFSKANVRLLVNCIKCAVDAKPWYHWRRYSLLLEAVIIYRACSKFGWIAWRSAYSKNNNQQRSYHA